jgi:hypothetical protein
MNCQLLHQQLQTLASIMKLQTVLLPVTEKELLEARLRLLQ